jgi:hypothetical protein
MCPPPPEGSQRTEVPFVAIHSILRATTYECTADWSRGLLDSDTLGLRGRSVFF